MWLSLFKPRRGKAIPEPRSERAPELTEVEQLVARARAAGLPLERDRLFREAAQAAVRLMTPAVRSFCREQLGGDEGLGDEATQQAWLVFWRVLPRFEGRSQLSTFVFGIAKNVCRDLRKLRRLEQGDEVEVFEWPDHDDRLEAERRRVAMVKAVEGLEPAARWLLEQRLVEERSYREILPVYRALFGEAIGTEEGLRSAFFKAKAALKAALGGRDE